MFLNNLNNKQKKLFIQLAIKAAEANGIVELEEKNMLKSFAIEMDIPPVYNTENNLETILNELVSISSEQELKIILFEILGIVVSDGVFDDDEKNIVKNIVERCKLDTNIVDEMLNALYEYINVYKKIVSIVL